MKNQNIFYQVLHPRNLILYLRGIKNDFGLKFTFLLISNYFAVKGSIDELLKIVHQPFYQQGGWSSSAYQHNMTIARIPWALKGFAGILTDSFPILGYEKSSWMTIYTLIGTTSLIILASFNMTAHSTPDIVPITLFLCIYAQIAFSDLMMEGKYVDLMKRNPENKGNVVSFSYFLITFGNMIPTFFVGALADNIEIRYIFYIFVPFSVQPLIFIFWGCMINDIASPERNNKIDFKKIKSQGNVMLVAFLIGLTGLGTIIIGLWADVMGNFLYNLIAGFILAGFVYVLLPKTIAKILIYIYCNFAFYIDISGHLEYFFTDKCIESGPHFSYVYLKTYAGTASIFASFIGIWVFQAILCNYKFRTMFWVTTFIRIWASAFDIIIIQRWNLAIGIPDKAMYMIGSAIIYKIAYYMDYMPCALMCAKLCPKEVETTMFAIVGGYPNFGKSVSNFVGNFMAKGFNVNINFENGICEHQNLVYLIVIGHLITPLISIILTFILIPDKYVYENIQDSSLQLYMINYSSKNISSSKEFSKDQYQRL